MSDWSFSLRRGHAGGYDSEDDSDDGHAPQSATLVSAEGADEDTVQFRESPWTIAKLHAVNKSAVKSPATLDAISAGQAPSSPKSTATTKKRPATAKRQTTLQDAFRKQVRRPPSNSASKPTPIAPVSKNSIQINRNPASKSEPSPAPSALLVTTSEPLAAQFPIENGASLDTNPFSSQGYKENARPSPQNSSRRSTYVPVLPVLRPEGLRGNSASPASPSAHLLLDDPTPVPPQASSSGSPVPQPFTHDPPVGPNITLAAPGIHRGMHIAIVINIGWIDFLTIAPQKTPRSTMK